MLPPIYKQVNSAASNSGVESLKRRGSSLSPGDASVSSRQERVEAEGTHGSSSGYLMERMQMLERENEFFRTELLHLRQLASNNNHQRDDEKMTLGKVTEELQRLLHAFNNKAQADGLFQQREQQKAALLFAELSRLGHTVESLDHTVRSLSDDTRRKLDQHEQQLALLASSVQNASGYRGGSPTKRSQEESHRQSEEIQWMKHALSQLRTEIESDRSERWKVESERSQWAADLRAAVSKTDATMDARIGSHLERVHSKLMADKMEMMRALDEYRELLTGADFKRMSSQLMEFTRINDHLLALERWMHTELSKIKRVLQASQADSDSRFQAIVTECCAALRLWSGVLQQQDDDWRVQFASVQDAVGEMAQHVQRKIYALEEVVPMEVRARQKHDEKLRRRMEAAVKSLSRAIESTRSEVGVAVATRSMSTVLGQPQLLDSTEALSVQFQTRVDALETSYGKLVKQVDEQHAALLAVLDHKPTKAVETVTSAASTEDKGAKGEDDGSSGSEIVPSESSSLQSETAVDIQSIATQWQADIALRMSEITEAFMGELTARHNDLLSKIEAVETDHGDAIASLRQWTVTHAQECRQCYEYFQWTLEQSQEDAAVQQTLARVVNCVVDAVGVSQ